MLNACHFAIKVILFEIISAEQSAFVPRQLTTEIYYFSIRVFAFYEKNRGEENSLCNSQTGYDESSIELSGLLC